APRPISSQFTRGCFSPPPTRASLRASRLISRYFHLSFHSRGLSRPLLDALAAKDYSQATPIQLQAIPTVLTGRDLLGIAQTGTGKNARFIVLSLHTLRRE